MPLKWEVSILQISKQNAAYQSLWRKVHGDWHNALYTYDAETGTYEKASGAASHYVTITAIYESTNPDGSMKRMLEISTWGQKQYVDFDEYIDYVSGNPTNQPFSSITNTTVK